MENEQNYEPYQEEKTIAEILGLDEKDTEQIKKFSQDMPSAVPVPEAPNKIFVTFLSDKIEVIEKERDVEISNVVAGVVRKSSEKVNVKMPLMKVRDDTGVPLTLWLTSKSAKREVMRLFYRHKSLEGLRVAIWTEKYIHKQFGEVRAYRFQVIPVVA